MLGRIGRLMAALRSRLRARQDSEHVMSFNRTVFCIIMAGYLWLFGIGPPRFPTGVALVGLSVTAGLFLHLLAYPRPNLARRFLALLADVGTITVVMHMGGEAAAIFFSLILWTVVGNGFRFGNTALWVSTGVGVAAFAVMAEVTPFWADKPNLAAGVEIGLIIVPAYASVLIRGLTKAKARAEAANAAKSAFLANVSHELRTPLQAIIGTTGLLAHTGLTAEQAESTRTVATAAQTLLSLISDLLHFSRIESGVIEIDRVAFGVPGLLREVKEMMSPAARDKHLRLAIHFGRWAPVCVEADRRHIREVLINMVANAVKFTRDGGVLIVASGPDPHDPAPALRFEVVDTGIGVPPEARSRIFERFAQADESIAGRFGGTGLGLAICKRLVEAMGGQIGVADGEGRGSVFWFTVPVPSHPSAPAPGEEPRRLPAALLLQPGMALGRLFKEARDQGRSITTGLPMLAAAMDALRQGAFVVLEVPAAGKEAEELAHVALDAGGRTLPVVLADGDAPVPDAQDWRWTVPVRLRAGFSDRDMQAAFAIMDGLGEAAADEEVASGGRQYHVLVADDNRTNRLVFAKILEGAGHSCRLVGSGDAALDCLESEQFDVVLMDVNMPQMSGIEATKLYRYTELGRRRVPIIGLTADATPETAAKCRAAGMDDCAIKPVSARLLLGLIDGLCAQEGSSPPTFAPEPPSEPAGGWEEISRSQLLDLERVGGPSFVQEVVEEYVRDTDTLLQELEAALDQADFGQAQAVAHAIASVSSNVGAEAVRKAGLALEKLPHARIGREGAQRVVELRQALARFHAQLRVNYGQAGGERRPG